MLEVSIRLQHAHPIDNVPGNVDPSFALPYQVPYARCIFPDEMLDICPRYAFGAVAREGHPVGQFTLGRVLRPFLAIVVVLKGVTTTEVQRIL